MKSHVISCVTENMEGPHQFQAREKQSLVLAVAVVEAVTGRRLWGRHVPSLHVEQVVEDHLVFVTHSHATLVQLDNMEMFPSQRPTGLRAETVLPELPMAIHK